MGNWEIFETAKPYEPSVQQMVDGGWISVGICYKGFTSRKIAFPLV